MSTHSNENEDEHEHEHEAPESSHRRSRLQISPPRRHLRHTPYQSKKLEDYFEEYQHPCIWTRQEIGKEIGLTPTQVKFWFQNKRTSVKEQAKREQGYHRLKSANRLLNDSFKELQNSRAQEIRNRSVIRQQSNGINIPIRNSNIMKPPLQLAINIQPLDLEMMNMIRALQVARDELMRLLHVDDPFWLKDKNDGRYTIHRDAYDSTFPKSSSTRDNRSRTTRFESSKYEAFLCISAIGVTQMLMDSKKRLDLFPTILTEAFTIVEYGHKMSPQQVGNLKLVYEQMHLLTPFAVPRESCYVRFCEKIQDGVWLIGETSLDFLTNNIQLHDSPAKARRLPSGCIIKDISPGVSKVVWMEHVEIDDNNSIHLLYKDVFLSGLAFGADRLVEILARSCDIIDSINNPLNQFVNTRHCIGEGIGTLTQSDKKCIMSLTGNIMKRFCRHMNMKNKLPISRQINMNEIYVSLCQCEEYSDPTNGLVVNASTTFWLPAPCQMIVDFLKDANLRAQWDVICGGKPGKEIACISLGDKPDNSISMIQPFGEAEKNILLVQETLVDPLGAIIVYAPIKIQDLNGELNGSPSNHILPSGFIIFKDGNPDCLVNVGGASTSRNVGPMVNGSSVNGSLVTVAFQAASNTEREFANTITSLISSTVRNIKLAFDFPNPNPNRNRNRNV